MDVMPAEMAAEARMTRASTADTPAPVTMPGFSPQIDQIVPALITLNADEAWGNPPKNRHIQVYPADGKPYFHSYTDLPNLLTHVRKTLAKHGFVLVHQINGTNLTVTLLHASGQYVRSAASVNPRQSTTHAIISEFTVMRRVMTGALLGIADGTTDDDGNAGAGHSWEERDTPPQGDAPTGFKPSAQMQESITFKAGPQTTKLRVHAPDNVSYGFTVDFSTPEEGQLFLTFWCEAPCTAHYFAKADCPCPQSLPVIARSLDAAFGESVSMAWADAAQAQSAEDFRELDRRINGEWADALDALRHTLPNAWQGLFDHIHRESQRFVDATPAFSHVVFDGQGDAVNMPHTDPGIWSREFLECWDACDPSDRQALLDHNADAIADLVQHPSAHSLLLDVLQAEDAQAAPEQTTTVTACDMLGNTPAEIPAERIDTAGNSEAGPSEGAGVVGRIISSSPSDGLVVRVTDDREWAAIQQAQPALQPDAPIAEAGGIHLTLTVPPESWSPFGGGAGEIRLVPTPHDGLTIRHTAMSRADADEHPGAHVGQPADEPEAIIPLAGDPEGSLGVTAPGDAGEHPEPVAVIEQEPVADTAPSVPTRGTVSVVEPPLNRSGSIDRPAYLALVEHSLAQCMSGADIADWEDANRHIYTASERIGPSTQARVLAAIAGRRRALNVTV